MVLGEDDDVLAGRNLTSSPRSWGVYELHITRRRFRRSFRKVATGELLGDQALDIQQTVSIDVEN